MANAVFIHTNAQQMVGAIVARHSLKRQSARSDAFEVRITRREDFPLFDDYEGRKFLRAGAGGSGATPTCRASPRCASARPSRWATRAAPW